MRLVSVVSLSLVAALTPMALGCDGDGGGGVADSGTDTDADSDTDSCMMGTYEGDIEIASQDDIEQLKGYTALSGDLHVWGYSGSDLSGLECLTSISELLYAEAAGNLTSFTGLDNLTYVHDVQFLVNDSLTDFSGLESLTTVDGSFLVEYNMSLTSMDGLESLSSAGALNLDDNQALTSLEGLSGLISLGGLGVIGSTALPDCEICELLDQLDTEPTLYIQDTLADGCTPVPSGCEEQDLPCDGYTGSDECCLNNNPCDWGSNDVCDCDSTCAWDAVDCEW